MIFSYDSYNILASLNVLKLLFYFFAAPMCIKIASYFIE